MAPGTRRANRSGYAEHDDFEGLPVRQWRQDWVTVAPPEQQEQQQQQNDVWAIELIHGMPKDAALLPPHTQELLRAARSGRLYKRPPPPEEEDAEAEAAPEKQEKKEEETVATGFSVKLWKQLPRSSEDTGLSHLAKRRKGTITVASKTVHEKAVGPTITRATVRRIDAAGNPYTEEVTLGEGQQVQGEIISTRLEVAPTGQPETYQPVPPPPPRKRAPPPKRKRAGPGRGKKKVKIPLPGAVQPAGVAPSANGVSAPKPNGEVNEAKAASEAPTNQDSEMADGDENDDDDDDDEGDEGDEGEEGEGDETASVQQRDSAPADEGTHLDKEMKDATPAVEEPESKEKMDVDMEDAAPAPAPSDPPKPSALPSAITEASLASPKLEGSPLKNEVLPPPPSESKPEEEISQVVEDTSASTEPLPQQGEVKDQEQKTEESENAPASHADVLPEPQGVAPAPVETPSTDALLPPPPDQVGNISSPNASPKDDSATFHSSLSADKAQDDEEHNGEDLLDKPMHDQSDLMSVDDTIKPEDSVSMGVPRTESGAPSEAATGSVGGTTEPESKAEQPLAQSPEKPVEQPSEQVSDQALEQLPDQPLEQPLEQPVEQPLEQPVEQPLEQPVEQPLEQLVEQTLEQPVEQLLEQPLEQSLEQPSVQTLEASSEQLPDQPSEQAPLSSEIPGDAPEVPTEEASAVPQPVQEEADLLDGLMGELDREASKTVATGIASPGPAAAEINPEPAPAEVPAEDAPPKSTSPEKEPKEEPEDEPMGEAKEEPLSEVKEELKEEMKDVPNEASKDEVKEETTAAEASAGVPAKTVDEK